MLFERSSKKESKSKIKTNILCWPHSENQQFYVLLINFRSSFLQTDAWSVDGSKIECLVCVILLPLSLTLRRSNCHSVSFPNSFFSFWFPFSNSLHKHFYIDSTSPISNWPPYIYLLYFFLCVSASRVCCISFRFRCWHCYHCSLLQLNQWQITYEMYVDCFLEWCALFISEMKK